MTKNVVIIGGGTAGCMIANLLARGLKTEINQRTVQITVVSDQEIHIYQPGFLYIPFHLKQPEELIRPMDQVINTHVHVILDRATQIDTHKQNVHLEKGESLPYDYLILATGSHPKVEEIPGLQEGGHMFYTMESALRLRDAMDHFHGGKVVVAVGLPHKCPIAPLEFTMMLEDWARQQGFRKQTEITYAYPLAGPYGTASVAEWAEKEFNNRNIHIETFFMIDHVNPEENVIVSVDGRKLSYDLLVVIPPHQGANVVRESKLGDKEAWLPTHRHHLRLDGQENIFVIGDATNLPISKAGSTAHFEAEILSHNLINLLRGKKGEKPYNGKVFCFIETGLNQATYISFDYENPPKPVPPSKWVHFAKSGYNEMHWVNVKGIL